MAFVRAAGEMDCVRGRRGQQLRRGRVFRGITGIDEAERSGVDGVMVRARAGNQNRSAGAASAALRRQVHIRDSGIEKGR